MALLDDEQVRPPCAEPGEQELQSWPHSIRVQVIPTELFFRQVDVDIGEVDGEDREQEDARNAPGEVKE